MAMPSRHCRGFESRQRNSKLEVWEILYRLFGVVYICAAFLVPAVDCLGIMSTVAAGYGGNSTTVCAMVEGAKVRCWHSGQNSSYDFLPNFRFGGISGGNDVLCGVVEGGLQVYCLSTNNWDRELRRPSNGTFLSEMAVGGTQICGLNETGGIPCWRWPDEGESPVGRFSGIAVGTDFVCGIENSSRTVKCWGPNSPNQTSGNMVYDYISAGVSHACGITAAGTVNCWGGPASNNSGLLNVPGHANFEFDSLALGSNHTCARRTLNGTVVCWGSIRAGEYPQNIQFETIVSGDEFVCGVVRSNLTVLCWGGDRFGNSTLIPELNNTLPWLCKSNQGPCPCGKFPNSDNLCGDGSSSQICLPCNPPPPAISPPSPPPPQASIPPPTSTRVVRKNSKATIPLAVAGSVGVFMGFCAIIWWIFFHRSKRQSSRVFDSEAQQQQSSTPPASNTTSRQTSRIIRRQRSGTSKPRDRPEEFTLADLADATGGFSDASKLGAGSFGTVYSGTLPDGRRVAIKRGETRSSKKHQETASAFESELNFLSRLHHKHLVALVGYCEEDDERLLVYEYMSQGSLYDHLHKMDQITAPLDSWAMRMKLALDAARGIEYLHTYAVPPIIHRDIKSSNILLDSMWNAKVADFGLSLLGPEDEDSHLSLMAAGTVGYIDPEYYKMQHLTTKSDVYSFGVVLMEMLTGKKAIHSHEGSGGSTPRNIVDYALPYIADDNLPSILDTRLPPPRPYEIEAVTFVGVTAAECVNLEGKDRPSMTEVVNNLEMALAFCTHPVISSSRSRSVHGSDDYSGVLR